MSKGRQRRGGTGGRGEAAGNANRTLNDTVEVQILPSMGAQIPTEGKRLFHDVLPHRFTDVHLPDYPGLGVEEVRVNVTETDTGDPPIFRDRETDVATDLLRLPWDARADDANYTKHRVNVTARHGGAALEGNFTLTRESTSLTTQYNADTSIAKGIMYGQVNASLPEDAFEATFESCDETANVTFAAQGFAQDVNLHTKDSWNLEWKNDTTNTSGLDELANVTWTDLTQSRDFDVTVKLNDSARADYELAYSTTCRQSDDGGDDTDDDPFGPEFETAN